MTLLTYIIVAEGGEKKKIGAHQHPAKLNGSKKGRERRR